MAVAESRAGGQWGWGWSAGLQVEEALDESGRAVAMAAGRGDELDLHPPLGSITKFQHEPMYASFDMPSSAHSKRNGILQPAEDIRLHKLSLLDMEKSGGNSKSS